ncbi:Dihydrofolate synthase/folylpolyglutamate synthase [Lawsonella clevelandensis]|uniref:Dihydrofolate synthase/folylpolyglutamate synthase n=1 Tax=Lawsonella clevelandensis TaxID=1528099 RepID=A0A5E3ZYH1_9ACTN|nr:Dihydrofolate synthase/folylpolyglutamate synthase [Lawsonella clevelandensis]
MSDLPKNLNYRDVYNADDPLASLRAGNPAALPEEEAYRNFMAGHANKQNRDEPCACQTGDKFADADEVARTAATEEADPADALAEYVFRESGLNLDALAAAAERIVDQASDEEDDEEFNPEAPFGLRRLNPLLEEDGVLTPEIQQNLRDLLSQFDEEQMDALARALDAYNVSHAGEDTDDAEDADSISGEDLYREYTGRIDIDTGDNIPDLTVYDEDDDPSRYRVEKPTAEDFAALAAVEKELDTRWGERQIAPDLSRMKRLMDMLGHPEETAPVIQVAGTNGKTSTARMIDALLRAMGQRVGRTTSPHLQLVTERISIDGAPISPRRYVEVWEDLKPFVEMVDAWSLEQGGPRMTKFEVLTAMAYCCFADTPVDVVVAEVGMGGRWDATSVARAEVAVVCPIGMDHMDYLGDTIEKIAAEKAGIIKPTEGENTPHNPHGTVAVISHQDPAALHVLLEEAVQANAVVARQGLEFEVSACRPAVGGQVISIQGLSGSYDDIFLPLYGEHQAENAAVALAAVEAFYGASYDKPLYDQAVHNGFQAVQSPGRLERVRTAPTVLLDACHNPHGAKALARALDKYFEFNRLVGVLAILGDKDARGILEALEPVVDKVILTTNSSPRALPVEDLAELARQVFDVEKIDTAPTLTDAIALATVEAENIDENGVMSGAGVIVTGSVVTAGEARSLFRKDPA